MGKKRNKLVKKHQDKRAHTQQQQQQPKQERPPSTESEEIIDLDEKSVQVETVIDEIKVATTTEAKPTTTTTDVEAANKLLMRKPIKSGSPSQRELKTLFVLSSNLGGMKSSLKKLNDCLRLFETLFERQPDLHVSNDWQSNKNY